MLATAIQAAFGLGMMVTVVLVADRLAERVVWPVSAIDATDPSADPVVRAPALEERCEALSVRAIVWLRRSALDWKLATSPDISGSRQLRLRAEQLTRPGIRRQLADRLELLLEPSVRSGAAMTTTISPSRDALAAAHAELLELVAILRTGDQPSPYGVAMVVRLLTDGLGPLYAADSPATLRTAVLAINAELARGSVATLEALWQLGS
jgi:hypothetical protein